MDNEYLKEQEKLRNTEAQMYRTLFVLLAFSFLLFVISLILAIQPDWAYRFLINLI